MVRLRSTRKSRKPRRRIARRRVRRIPRNPRASTQMASITETIEIQNINVNQNNFCTFSLSQFTRANQLGEYFKWYKPVSVTWILEPMFNVYQSGTSNPAVPYLYKIMNRTQDNTPLILNDFLAQGAKPIKFNKPITIRYKPNWCSPGLLSMSVVPISGFGGAVQNIVQQGLKPEYGWLQTPNQYFGSLSSLANISGFLNNLGGATNIGNTMVSNASARTLFNGHAFYLEQYHGVSGIIPAKLSCKVHWVFKDSKYTQAGGQDNVFTEDLSGNYSASSVIT